MNSLLPRVVRVRSRPVTTSHGTLQSSYAYRSSSPSPLFLLLLLRRVSIILSIDSLSNIVLLYTPQRVDFCVLSLACCCYFIVQSSFLDLGSRVRFLGCKLPSASAVEIFGALHTSYCSVCCCANYTVSGKSAPFDF